MVQLPVLSIGSLVQPSYLNLVVVVVVVVAVVVVVVVFCFFCSWAIHLLFKRCISSKVFRILFLFFKALLSCILQVPIINSAVLFLFQQTTQVATHAITTTIKAKDTRGAATIIPLSKGRDIINELEHVQCIPTPTPFIVHKCIGKFASHI